MTKHFTLSISAPLLARRPEPFFAQGRSIMRLADNWATVKPLPASPDGGRHLQHVPQTDTLVIYRRRARSAAAQL